MRNLIPLLLTLMCQSFLQAQLPGSETQRFFKIAVSNSHTAKPFGSFSSLFYQNFHPGVELGYETILADKRKHQWIFETRAGYLFHRYVQHNIALLANAGYRYGPLPGWSAEIRIGAGYQHSIADSKLFEITETEGLKKKRNMGRSQAIGAFSVGVSRKIIREYNQIPSVELWNYESINSSISQIEYYRDARIFSNQADLNIVVDSLLQTLDHLQLQAEKGVKFLPGANEVSHKAPLRFYVNEVVLGSNSILVQLNQTKLSIITYSVLSYLLTTDPRFSENAFKSFNNLVSRSVLISSTGERERNRFFSITKRQGTSIKTVSA